MNIYAWFVYEYCLEEFNSINSCQRTLTSNYISKFKVIFSSWFWTTIYLFFFSRSSYNKKLVVYSNTDVANRAAVSNEPVENLVILFGELLIADGKNIRTKNKIFGYIKVMRSCMSHGV